MTGEPRPFDAGDVVATQELLRPHLRRTPVLEVHLDGIPVTLKLEQTQVSGSFKARGAFTHLLRGDLPAAGVVAASGGNHGVAVAWAAGRLGVPAAVFVPTVSSPAKVARIRELGAELVVGGDRYADALAAAQAHGDATGALAVHAFDARDTILGQATLGAELDEQVPELDTVLVPVGGGGLIAGVAAWFGDATRVIGVEPLGSPTLARALAAGGPVDAPTEGVASDALAPRRVGELVFPIAHRFVDDVVLVDDDAILAARSELWRAAHVVAEPAASVGVAALRSGAYRPAPGERVAVVVSGANTDPGDVQSTHERDRTAAHA